MRLLTIASLAAAALVSAAPASAVVTTFADFSNIGNAANVRWVISANNSGGNFSKNATFYSTATGTANIAGARRVNFNFSQPALAGVASGLQAMFTLNGTVTNTQAVVNGTVITQNNISGTFSFIQAVGSSFTVGGQTFGAGVNLLSGSFTQSSISGQRNGTSAGWSASTLGGSAITYTSDVLGFVPGSNYDLAWSLASVAPLLNATNAANQITGTPNKALRTFRAVVGGQFSSDPAPITPAIPEPAIWAQLIIGFSMVGFASRRRKVSVAA
ncbi:MAG: hypothetical protein CFE37_06035 [Alphaproteobacteria bacterium PA4]|nr:MAG: hypothetical protein CFE37_06035 [Alphaproteobacteria bacterium PA4]